MAEQRKCGTCALYASPPGKRAWHGHAYRCLWKLPDIAWPDSMAQRLPNIVPQHMAPGDGLKCPQWQPRESAS